MTVNLPIPGVAKVTMQGHCVNVVADNVFHINYSTDFLDTAECNAIASAFYAAYCTAFKSLFASGTVIDSCTVQDLVSDTGAVGSFSGTTAGTNVSTPGPANVSACLTWHVATHYKGGHPRTYLPFVPNNVSTDGRTWASGHYAILSPAPQNFLTAVNAINIVPPGPITLVAVHRVRNKVVLSPPTFEVIQRGSVDTRVDSMRRRLGRDVPG